MEQLKKVLDRFYAEYDFRGRIQHDPIEFPHLYRDPGDIEVAGFIAASLAYGKVDLFKSVVGQVLSKMGKSPYGFLLSFQVKKEGKLFRGIKYRFNENEDIICLLFILHEMLRRHASLESAFKKSSRPGDRDIGNGLIGLMEEISSINTSRVYGENIKPPGLVQFFPSPARGSACKRLNLFLRWMIRDRDMDFGIWKGIPKNRLVIPLDTHIARISICLGLTERKSQGWKMAVEITDALREFDREDPLKYDFALCHHGISGVCSAAQRNACRGCSLKTLRPA